MIKMISVKEAARQWNITERRVAELCRNGRIKGAMRQGRNWQIPADALKPADKRIRSGYYRKNQRSSWQPYFKDNMKPTIGILCRYGPIYLRRRKVRLLSRQWKSGSRMWPMPVVSVPAISATSSPSCLKWRFGFFQMIRFPFLVFFCSLLVFCRQDCTWMFSSEDTVLPDTWKMNFPTLPFRWGR